MPSLNLVQVMGNLGADPEMRYTANGNAVTNFTVAANRRYTTRDGEVREEVEWFRVVTWNATAEACSRYLSKGRPVYVQGRLQTRSYEDRDGITRYVTEVIAERVEFLDPPPARRQQGGQDDEGGYDASDLPF